MTDLPRPARRRRPGALFAAGVLTALLMIAIGVVLVVRGYQADDGPGGTVRGYFTAVARAKARTALAYGTIPPGPHTLLTGVVMKRQLAAAPLRDFSVKHVEEHGDTARVTVTYELGFKGNPQHITTTVPLVKRAERWRLTAVATLTQLRPDAAVTRLIVSGPPAATATTLVFPGAAPLSFDTPMLTFDPRTDHIELGGPPVTDLDVLPTPAATAAARAAVLADLRTCLAGQGPITCPQPTQRYVPGSLRGTLVAGSAPLTVSVTGAAGLLRVAGTVTVSGSWQRLTFANRAVAGSGTVSVPIAAHGYARSPLTFAWTSA